MSQTIESIKTYPAATMEQIKGAMDEAVSIVRQDLPVFTDKFPDSNSKDGFISAYRKCRVDHRFLDRMYLAFLRIHQGSGIPRGSYQAGRQLLKPD